MLDIVGRGQTKWEKKLHRSVKGNREGKKVSQEAELFKETEYGKTRWMQG